MVKRTVLVVGILMALVLTGCDPIRMANCQLGRSMVASPSVRAQIDCGDRHVAK